MNWRPPFRFDFARTGLEYVPPHLRQALVERLLQEYLAPRGRLIVCSYGSSRHSVPKAEPVGDVLRGHGYPVAGETEGTDTNGAVFAGRVAGPTWLGVVPATRQSPRRPVGR